MRHNNISGYLATAAVACLMLLASCTDWLDVEPKNKILDKQAFKTEEAIQVALNGLYLTMANKNIYGSELSVNTIELLGQWYMTTEMFSTSYVKELRARYYMANYTYGEDLVKGIAEDIWTAGYNLLINTNLFIEKMEVTGTSVISTAAKKDILHGEALAIRAYMHFDLLRMFGPVYANESKLPAIPYYTKSDAGKQARLSAEEVMSKILADIDLALELLEDDPVRTEGVRVGDEYIGDFYAHRNRRMNYYAVAALKARVLMYELSRGSDSTVTTAEVISLIEGILSEIEGDDTKFPWATLEQATSQSTPDRIYSSEVLFGIHSSNMYSYHSTWFSTDITSTNYLVAANSSTIEYMFGSDFTSKPDWRVKNWITYKNPDYICAYKFARTEEATFNYFQPLIRKTELYLMLSELKNTVSDLNTVRQNRGLLDLEPGSTSLATEIHKEFMRETYGEGQLFYFYKRKNMTTIRNGQNGNNLTMDNTKYVVPIPDSELAN